MAINKNHEFEDIDGVKCAIVEKNVSLQRVDFLKQLLEYNRFRVVIAGSPPPKAVATSLPVADPAVQPGHDLPPATFTVGVTDVMFNAINAIFGRLLHTPDGRVVTLAYWQQKEAVSKDELPYFEKNRD